ncbi:MAG: hypothetical protein K8U03_25210 [Planctomycetia bacterium]|nr:hypothetical protein [Planctomycetia bacterium]
MRIGLLLSALGLIATLPARVVAQPPPPPAVANQSDAASELNLRFRGAYARARGEVLRGTTPIILFDGEKLVLVEGDRRQAGTLLPVKYQRLKALAHLPFTAYLELRDPATKPTAENLASWTQLRKLIAEVERELPTYEFTAEELARQRSLAAESARIFDDALAGAPPTREQLLEFTRRMGPLQEANAEAAAAIELDHYRRQVEAWRANLSDEQWNRLRVVIAGSQMPRRRHRVVQLFAALLEVAGEGPRIIYAEALYDPDKALNLLGTHLLDSESAAAFFDDPARLDEDLLSRGAAKYVREHFPKSGG